MDATFIIDKDYDGFSEALEDFQRLLTMVGRPETGLFSPLRISLANEKSDAWYSASALQPSELGWIFCFEATPKSMEALDLQLHTLVANDIRFRVGTTETGRHEGVEYRFDPKGTPHVAIPFEDAVANAPKFFSSFSQPMAKVFEISIPKVTVALTEFCRHSEAHLKEETPFPVEQTFFIPRHGHVGRHEIFKELHIQHQENDLMWGLRMLEALEKHRAQSPVRLFLQFFLPFQNRKHVRAENNKYLLEQTLLYEGLSYAKGQPLLSEFRNTAKTSEAVRDVYFLFEVSGAGIQGCPAATMILRKTRKATYEIRSYLSWDGSEIDPEAAVMPLEEKSGLIWAHIQA